MSLHILSVSPWTGNAFRHCLAALAPGDVLLLTGDGVYAALRGSDAARAIAAKRPAVRTFALAMDCQQRGVLARDEGIECIDHAGFVALACEQSRSVSWF